MPQAKRQVEVNDFRGGFNTEQSPLRADPSTTIEEQNLVIAADGSRARRYGYAGGETLANYQLLYTATDPTPLYHPIENQAIQFNRVRSINNAVDNEYYTYDYTLCTRNASASSVIFHPYRNSDGALIDTSTSIDISVVSNTDQPYLQPAQWGSYLLMPAQGGIETFVSTTSGSKTVGSVSAGFPIKADVCVRDLFGLDDALPTAHRPATLSENHAYNLLNQGWTTDNIVKFFTEIGSYPSNADAPYYGLVPDTNSAANPPPMLYDAELLKQPPFPLGAPKGNYYVSIYRSGESRNASHVTQAFTALNSALGTSLSLAGLSDGVDSEWRVNCVSIFLGRVFYTGTITGQDYVATDVTDSDNFPSPHNLIAFTRILETGKEETTQNLFNEAEDAATPLRCSSSLNPTSEDFTPTPSDGGFFFVDGAEEILGSYAIQESLVIVATNGIWELRAQDGVSPSTFILNKVMSARIRNAKGITVDSNFVLVPTEEGLQLLSYDANMRRVSARDITDKTIRSFYTKHFSWIAASTYDIATDTVRWLLRTPPVYTDGAAIVTVEQKELILDKSAGAFTVNTYPSTDAVVRLGPDDPTTSQQTKVLDPYYARKGGDVYSGEFIMDYISTPNVLTLGDTSTPVGYRRNRYSTGFLTLQADTFGSVGFRVPVAGDFTDLGEVTEQSSYMVTNPFTLGDTIRNKDITYLWTHFHRTEDGFEDPGDGDWVPTNQSGCLLSARWDFSDDASSGKWTTPRQIYRLRDYLPEDINDTFNYGHSIITTKNNVPGRGKALSLKFEAETGKDMQIIGWGTELKIEGAV